MLEDFGRQVNEIVLEVDSSGSLSMLQRTGLGRVRHLDTGLLWIQGHVKRGLIRVKKILGTENSADLGTKELNAVTMWKHLSKLGFAKRDGKHKLALAVDPTLRYDTFDGVDEGD